MATIADVASHAGVSMSTVSYVLSGKRPISEETRRRVQASIRALGYHPHAGARALASSRSNVIALVIPLRTGVHVPVMMQFVVSVVTSARSYDHDVLLLTQDEGLKGLRRVAAGALCVEHLAGLGHTGIGMVGSPRVVYQRETGFAQRLLAGVREAAGRRGV